MTLVDIEKELQDIFDTLEENGGELTPELEKRLAISEDDFANKVQKYLLVIKGFESDSDCIKQEITRLTARKKSKDAQISRLKKTIIDALESFGNRNAKGNAYLEFPTGKVTVAKSHSVDIDNSYVGAFIAALNDKINTSSVYEINNNIENLINTANKEASTEIDENAMNCMKITATIDFELKDISNASDAYRTMLEAVDGLNGTVATTCDKNKIKGCIKETGEVPKFITYNESKYIKVS